jgi:hypothetical protein
LAIKAGEVFVPVRPDLSGFSQQMAGGVTTAANQASGTIGSSLKQTFTGIGGQLATGLVGGFAAVNALGVVKDFVAGSIQAASALQESISKVGVVFGDSSDDIREWASDSATQLGISEQAALEAAGTYGNLFSALGLSADAAADMSTSLVDLSADLASFNNANPEDVLLALRSGLVGEVEPLRKFGVSLNQARIEQVALNEGLWDGVGTLDAAAKAQAAYKIILEDTALAQGDFERTSDGLANQQRILTAEWENLQATIGTKLLPVALDVVSAFRTYVDVVKLATSGTEGLDTSVAELATRLGDIGGGLTQTFAGLLPGGQLISSLFDLGDAVRDAVAGAGDWRTALDELHEGLDDGTLTQADYLEGLKAIEEQYGVEIPLIEELEAAQADQAVATDRLNEQADAYVDAMRKGLFATEDSTSAHRELIDAIYDEISANLALIDPVFAVINAARNDADATERLAEARSELARLTREGKTDTEEYAEALQEVEDASLEAVTAQADLYGSVITLREGVDGNTITLKEAKGALRDMAGAAGLSADEFNTLWDYVRGATDELERWNRTDLEDKNASVIVDVVVHGQFPGSPQQLQHGGIVTRPTLALIGEAGPEAVIPLDKAGAVAGGVFVEVNVPSGVVGTTALDIARIIRTELLREQDRVGGLGFR